MTIDSDSGNAAVRIARKNAVRKSEKASRCPNCAEAPLWRKIASLWKSAYVMRDDVLADIAWDEEQKIVSMAARWDDEAGARPANRAKG